MGHRRRGFTLMESMFASVLLAVSVTAVSGTMTASYASERAAAEESAAQQIARQTLEELAALPIDAANSGDDSLSRYVQSTAPGATPVPAVTTTLATGTYTRRATVTRHDSLNSTGPSGATTGQLALVTVEVTTPAGRVVRQRRLVTARVASN